jgi:hypothetical protein
MAEGARRIFADYQPIRPLGQLLGFAAISCWALATRLLWPALPLRRRREGVRKQPSRTGLTAGEGALILGAPRERNVAEATPAALRAVDNREQE